MTAKAQKPSKEILALPRRERRRIWRDAHRGIPVLDAKLKPVLMSANWDDYRRWDGGKPVILKARDLLKMRDERKAMAREGATDSITPEIRAAGILSVVRSRIRGLAAHRMFRRKTA